MKPDFIKPDLKSLELFSGAGGLAIGLERVGFRHLNLIESNKQACKTLELNFDPSSVWCGDARDYILPNIHDLDLIAGGPPCQPFSLGGNHQANLDHRDMFPKTIQIIANLLPKTFIIENVKGLSRPAFAEYFEYLVLGMSFPDIFMDYTLNPKSSWQNILKILRSICKNLARKPIYSISHQIINAADYGVPQTRERIIMVGIRHDLPFNWKFPSPTHSQNRLLWDQYITGEYWDRHQMTALSRSLLPKLLQKRIEHLEYELFPSSLLPWRTARDALWDLPDPRADHGIEDHVFRDGARSYPGHTGSELDWPCKTIKAGNHGVPGGENMIRFIDGTLRYLTVLEAKRIQTFPDTYKITGKWGEAMRQIGNAVPVLLAEKLGVSLFELLTTESVVAPRRSTQPVDTPVDTQQIQIA